jgi:hypothetical protein
LGKTRGCKGDMIPLPHFKTKTRQRLLQVSMGIGLLFLAFLIEMVIIEPTGIYSYSLQGYKGFNIGLSREGLLKEINKIKVIRKIISCGSSDVSIDLKLISRRFFDMTPDLDRSDVWICRGKKNVGFLFQFEKDRLVLVLRLKCRSFEPGDFPLFEQCQPEIYRDILGYLNRQTGHEIFYKDD